MFRDILFVIVLITSAKFAAGGECCNSYTDRHDIWHDTQYCSTYCCDDYKSNWLYTSLRCCSSLSKRAYSSYRIDSCGWWQNNSSWAIALIVIGNLAIIGGCIVCCVFCVKGCCGQNHRTGVVMMQAQQQGGVVMMNQMSQMSQNQGAQYPPPSNYGNQPPPYPSGSYGNQPPPPFDGNQGLAPVQKY